MRPPLAPQLSNAAEAILDGGRPQVDGRVGRSKRRDVEPLLARAQTAVAAYVAFADAGDDATARRAIVRDRSVAVEGLDASFPMPVAAYELGEQHRMSLLPGQCDLADAAVRVARNIPGIAGDLLTMEAGSALQQRHDREARTLVGPVLNGEVPRASVASTIVAWLVEATSAIRNDQEAVGHDALLRAVHLAAPNGCVRLMREASPEVVAAMSLGRGRSGEHEAFVEQVPEGRVGTAAMPPTTSPGS